MWTDADIEMAELQEDVRRIESARKTPGRPYISESDYPILRSAWFSAAMAYTAATPLILEALAEEGITIDDSTLFDEMLRAKAEWEYPGG